MATTTIPEKVDEAKNEDKHEPIHIQTALACYVCKSEVNTVHHFYDQVRIRLSDWLNSVDVYYLW